MYMYIHVHVVVYILLTVISKLNQASNPLIRKALCKLLIKLGPSKALKTHN